VLACTVGTFNGARAFFPFVLSTTVGATLLSTAVGSDEPESVAVKTSQWSTAVGSDEPESVAVKTSQWFLNVRFHFERRAVYLTLTSVGNCGEQNCRKNAVGKLESLILNLFI